MIASLSSIERPSDTPLIGICAAAERAQWSVWDMPAALVAMNYIEHVQRAGAVAVLIPPDPVLADEPGRVLDRIDGLLLVGGADVGAGEYGAEPHPLAETPVPLRDAVESALTREAVARGLPVLGICRGAQVINVAAGGTLVQHLPDVLGHDGHRRRVGHFAGNEHDVHIAPGSRALEAAGGTPHRVVSHHHQAVGEVGEGLRVTARDGDGLPEAVEGDGEGWLLGVQWHPEADPGSGVIAALVAAAARRRREDVGRGEGGGPSTLAAHRDERS
ncbi:MAG TPA: gamma-glutamyl-gamma-aminobutyrate hydrolase family protein [Miltoncostaeaceae bacterium]|nr:gamma-glutamyl-gamma-aminobutyrate hydrolase family protein [Miltoncostaeaceae bacterium]